MWKYRESDQENMKSEGKSKEVSSEFLANKANSMGCASHPIQLSTAIDAKKNLACGTINLGNLDWIHFTSNTLPCEKNDVHWEKIWCTLGMWHNQVGQFREIESTSPRTPCLVKNNDVHWEKCWCALGMWHNQVGQFRLNPLHLEHRAVWKNDVHWAIQFTITWQFRLHSFDRLSAKLRPPKGRASLHHEPTQPNENL